MSLRYIFGLPQSGKTHRVFAEIIEGLNNTSRPLFLIVPEQFSMSAEKSLISALPAPAVTRAQVLSFRRLAYYVFARGGAASGKPLDDIGKSMLIRKILNDNMEKLRFYARSADKAGFVGLLSRQVSEFRQYGVSPVDLADVFPQNAKFQDIRVILDAYEEALKEKYLSNDDTLSFLPAKIESSRLLDNAAVLIDGFFSFTPQERTIIQKLLTTCDSVTVALTLNEAKASFPNLKPFDLFFETKDTVNKLTASASVAGVGVQEPLLMERPHASKEIGSYRNNRIYMEETRDITLISADSRREEVRALADEILSLTRGGLRYRDIAVIVCGADYERELREAFRQYGIPAFMDEKTDVFCHPLTEFLRSAISVFTQNRNHESVFRFLKTGLTDARRDDIDVLENYVLSHGIKGYKWDLEWDAPEKALSAREALNAALSPLNAVAGEKRRPLQDYAAALLEMLSRVNALDKLDALEEEAASMGGAEVARRFGRMWPIVADLFECMTDILGDETVTLKVFGQILDAGLESADLGVIPPSADQVIVGDFDRSRFPQAEALIVLGANEDVLPKPIEEDSILTDNERFALAARGFESAPDRKRLINRERLLIYCGLSRPRGKLTLIYREKDASSVVAGLKKLFPKITAIRYTGETIPPLAPLTNRLSAMLSQNAKGVPMPDDFARAYCILRNDPRAAWAVKALSRLSGAVNTPEGINTLSRLTVKRMYGGTITAGVSRLEKYAECPFSYFMRYNMKAAERDMYEVGRADMGSLYHAALEHVSKAANQREGGWRGLTGGEIAALADEAVESAARLIGGGLLYSTAGRQFMLKTAKRVCERSVWALAEHIRRGSFVPVGAETEFGEVGDGKALKGMEIALGDGRALNLTGRIDRVDILDTGEKKYVKIIDYKSGYVKFNIADAYLGTQLQLLLYLDALLKNGYKDISGLSPGGVFYFHIDDPIVADTDDESELAANMLKTYKMSGLSSSDKAVINGMDDGLTGHSSVFPAYVLKDGALGAVSSVTDEDGFTRLRALVTETIKSIGEGIFSGDVAPRPVKNGRRAGCDFCEYGAVCGFDKNNPNGYRTKPFQNV